MCLTVLRCVRFFFLLFSFFLFVWPPPAKWVTALLLWKKGKKLPPQADSRGNNGANPTPPPSPLATTQPSAGAEWGWTRSPPLHTYPQQSSPGPTGSAPPHKGTFFRINRQRLLPVGSLLPLCGLHQSGCGQIPVTGSIAPQTQPTVVSLSNWAGFRVSAQKSSNYWFFGLIPLSFVHVHWLAGGECNLKKLFIWSWWWWWCWW